MINSIRGNPHEGELVQYTKELLTSGVLDEETGVATGWRRHGGLSVTGKEDMMKEFRMWTALGKHMGWDAKMVDAKDIKYIHPLIKTDELLGGLYVASDGSVDPSGSF